MAVKDIVGSEARVEQEQRTQRVLPLPPLQSGDRLTRYEFERRYEAMPELKKAELVEGVVYVPSPIRHKSHSQPHAKIMGWLATYHAATPGTDIGDNATVRLDMDNEVQPDAWLRIEGGLSRIDDDDYLPGPPELIVEIAASSVAYDLHDKLKVYRRSGVQEYLVWQIFDNRLDWLWLNEKGEYVTLSADESGLICSQVFPGLQLNVPALLKGDLAQVLAVGQAGLGTEAHQQFVEKLREQSGG
jgi:Uma2 family endonuclease